MPTRIEHEPDRFVPPVVLYLSDIKDILSIIEEGTESKATISAGEYVYNSLDDLVANCGKTVTSISFDSDSRKPTSVRLFISAKSSNSLYVMGQYHAIYKRLMDIFNRRGRASNRFASFYNCFGMKYFLASLLLGFVSGFLLPYTIHKQQYVVAGILALMAAVLLSLTAAIFASTYIEATVFSRIHLVNAHKKPQGFLKRNWEKIAVAIILMLVGATVKSCWDWASEKTKRMTVQQESETIPPASHPSHQ